MSCSNDVFGWMAVVAAFCLTLVVLMVRGLITPKNFRERLVQFGLSLGCIVAGAISICLVFGNWGWQEAFGHAVQKLPSFVQALMFVVSAAAVTVLSLGGIILVIAGFMALMLSILDENCL